jgi:hypothetical protein
MDSARLAAGPGAMRNSGRAIRRISPAVFQVWPRALQSHPAIPLCRFISRASCRCECRRTAGDVIAQGLSRGDNLGVSQDRSADKELDELAKRLAARPKAGPWGRKYPAIAQSWRRNWEQVIPFFAFAPEVRTILYTTNAIESLNAQVRKAVRLRGYFPARRRPPNLSGW